MPFSHDEVVRVYFEVEVVVEDVDVLLGLQKDDCRRRGGTYRGR